MEINNLNVCSTVLQTANTLSLSNELIRALETLSIADWDEVSELYTALTSNNFAIDMETISVSQMKSENGPLRLLGTALLQAHFAHKIYSANGIPDLIWHDTFFDISIWCDNCKTKNGRIGLENIAWLQYHSKLELFRLGRLQFQMAKLMFPHYIPPKNFESQGIHAGDSVLMLHIPQGKPLTPNDCDQSLMHIRAFCRAFFPEYADVPILCESWLLYPNNQLFMTPNCNILSFASRFKLLGIMENPSQAIERIWSWSNSPIDELAEKTTLQRTAKQYLQSGGKLGEGFGLLRAR